MKNILLFTIILTLLCSGSLPAADKLSPNARMALKHAKESPLYSPKSNVMLNEEIFGCLVWVKEGFDENLIKNAGGIIGTKAGNIWTVRCRLDAIEKIATLDKVIYLQLDEPISRKLDAARKYSFIDSVHNGVSLNHGKYMGKGVVTGIIDCGFDYTNPNFYDTTTHSTRIRKVWEQKRTGTPPPGYSYGRELLDTTAMFAAGTDTSRQSHGTHVAGIVCGTGHGTTGLYQGVAPKSDIVMVAIHPERSEWASTSVSSMVDGMAYILRYAESVGEPVVCNLSWGLSIGPHDGTSLFCQAMNNLSGKGKMLVVAAGNEGEEYSHFNHTFSTADTTFSTFFNFSPYYTSKKTNIDFWGDSLKDFNIRFSLYDTVNHKDGNSVSFNVKSSPLVDTLIVGSDGDSCFVSVSASAVEFNGKPRMFVYLENHSMDKVLITGTGTSGKINFWNAYTDNFEGFYGTFSADNMPWASNGNTDITISDFPCGDSIISVAAYTTKNHWTSVNLGGYSYSTTFGSLASFSSHGPRVDGFSKPDIAAPGFGVVSSVNSFDTSFSANHSMVPYVVKNYKYGNVNYKYAIMSGTSMASPMVCGVVALMLEKNPNLTPSEIRNILQSTATVDTFVTNTNNPNLWGAGKLNAWAAMKAIDGITDVETQEQPDQVEALIYPNPSNGTFNIDLKDMATVSEIKIYDLLGNCVFTRAIETIGKQMITINAENLSEGQYFVEVMGSAGMRLLKLVIRK